MEIEVSEIFRLLDSFLGERKTKYIPETLQVQYCCPRCAENDGVESDGKFNLELNLRKQKFACWKCGSLYGDMHGNITRLIRKYGNEQILSDYINKINDLKNNSLYKINSLGEEIIKPVVELPYIYRNFSEKNSFQQNAALEYLSKRRIGWNIINQYKIGYTYWDNNYKDESLRIVIPSFDEYGNLNYWTGRDYSGKEKRKKYLNPDVKRKDLIFNENQVEWYADITLVEGPFDHIVVPNSIPLLGKSLTKDYILFKKLYEKSNANIIIFLDADAYDTAKTIYKFLNHGKLYDRIRFVPVPKNNMDLDPAKIYETWGEKGIIKFLSNAVRIPTIELLK
jgi:DNA primase